MNDGLGEGVSYRGRLLIALKTDISDSIDTAPSEVEVMATQSINEVRKSGAPTHYKYAFEFRRVIFELIVVNTED